jgi:hypothetical protein
LDPLNARLLNLESRIAAFQTNLTKLESRLETDISSLKSTCDPAQCEIDELRAVPRIFPLNGDDPLNDIIAELTRKCKGNVHDNKIVLITRSSSGRDIADLASNTSSRRVQGKRTSTGNSAKV